MSHRYFTLAFAAGLLSLAWVAQGFVGSHALALSITALITAVYLLGAWELRQFRGATAALAAAVAGVASMSGLPEWLERVPPALRPAVRGRIEGQARGLPGPALTPYLVGLLVMLGMLGTFLGMVVTFKGAVFALEGSADVQAMRGALAEPIKGLGLSFGTSVAGVAASAMLGLMSALARRERLEVVRALDACTATVLRPYSPAFQREASLQALQAQASALPQVLEHVQLLLERIEQRHQHLDEQLLARQANFQDQAAQSYSALATSVGTSLQASLVAGARAAGESITPVVSAAMAQVVEQAERLHSRLGESAQAQLDGLSAQFSGTARGVAEQWTQALASHERSSQALSAQLHTALASFGSHFEERSTRLLAQVQAHLQAAQAGQAQAEAQRAGAWTQALHSLASELQAQWQAAAQQAMAQQQTLSQALEAHARQVAERASAQAGRTMDEAQALLSRSEGLVQSRQDTEAQWHAQHGQRMDQLAGVWRQELQALRHDEAQRGQAAVDRLGALEAAVAQHLASLGASLEAPLNRLLHTAAEVPQAAAGVITQLRQEMGRMGERDNLALQERTALLAQLHTLVQAVNVATGEQRAAIEVLVDAAGSVMQTASERFAQVLDSQASLAQDSATQVGSSAVELASLGDAFGQSVQQFQVSNQQLVQGLQRIEQSLNRSTARSDEQLAYYVAQAREVIDLSIASQAGLIEQLRQLQPPPGRALAEGDRA